MVAGRVFLSRQSLWVLGLRVQVKSKTQKQAAQAWEAGSAGLHPLGAVKRTPENWVPCLGQGTRHWKDPRAWPDRARTRSHERSDLARSGYPVGRSPLEAQVRLELRSHGMRTVAEFNGTA